MPSALDRKYDAVLAAVTGESGRVQIGRDAQGRAIVTNLPATLPVLFDAFCDAERRGRGGGRRRGAADLRRAPRAGDAARAGAGRQLERRQGRPRRHRDAQLPGLDRRLYGGAQGGRHRHPDQRLVAGRRDAPRARPVRARADHRRREPRASGSTAGGCTIPIVALPIDAAARRGAGAAARARRRSGPARGRARRTTRRSCSPRARPASPRARSRPTARSPPASIPMRSASRPCSASRRATARRRRARPRPWSTCRCSTSPARCRCCSTASSSAGPWC